MTYATSHAIGFNLREHKLRINRELREAGATSYGVLKFVGQYLPKVLHPDEHIEAVIYGRYHDGTGLWSLSEGWLVATDRRVIFIDHKPGYTNMDEMGFDAVT